MDAQPVTPDLSRELPSGLTVAEQRRAVRWIERYQWGQVFDQATIDRLVFTRWLAARQRITDWPADAR